MASQGLETQKLGRYLIPQHDDTKSSQKKNMARTWPKIIKGSNAAKNQKLNMEDHMASMPTGPRKKTYLPCQLLISYTGLLVEIRV
jgi:hypothetical protein